MAYIQGDDILDDEYNVFATGAAAGTPVNHAVSNISTLFGTGDSADKGWGQTIPVSAVSAGGNVSATQWASLLNAINTASNHQNTTITAITNPITGDDIEAYAALQANLNLVFSNRLDCAASGTPITAGGSVTRTTGWTTSVTQAVDITFTSVNAMRYFFNAGGRISVATSRSGGTVHSKNTEWTNLCNAMGTIYLTGASGAGEAVIAGTTYTGTTKVGGSGTPSVLLTGTGYHDLTSTFAKVFEQFENTAPYTANNLSTSIKVVGSVITISMFFGDTAADDFDDTVDGNLNTTVTLHPPSTTYISNSWGTPTMSGSQSGS